MKRTSLFLASLSLVSGAAHATNIVVGPSGSIQTAINSAVNGDTIEVQGGTHFEHIDFSGKAITVWANGTTTIDGSSTGRVVTFNSGEDLTSSLVGFTIKNGQDSGSGGGGIFCSGSSPTILNCTVMNNKADQGGGIALSGSNASIRDCTIYNNDRLGFAFDSLGGNIFTSGGSPKIVHCTIGVQFPFTNTWTYGAGVYVSSGTPLLKDCTIASNVATTEGGGLYVLSGTAKIRRCNFSLNHAIHGAAVATDGSGAVDVRDSSFTFNTVTGASGNGGAMQIKGSGASLVNTSTIVDNHAALRGGGIYSFAGTVTIQNTILWGNTNTSGNTGPDLAIEQGATANVSFTDVTTPFVNSATLNLGSGNLNTNPVFESPSNFHLKSTSFCIDAGDPGFLIEKGEVDFTDEEPRISNIVDMGMDEFRDCDANSTPDWQQGANDCNGNHVPDSCDIAANLSFDTNLDGIPDECQFQVGTQFCFCPVPTSSCGNFDASAGCQNSLFHGGVLTANGTASIAANDLHFVASHIPNNVSATMFAGDANQTGVSLDDGLMCVTGTVTRLGTVNSNFGGCATWGPGLNALGGWAVGQTRYFQAQYRNPTGPCGFGKNMTSGMIITFVP